MFCPQCGKEYSEKVNFCSQCGTAMDAPRRRRNSLTRSRDDKKIAGICGGFAEYFNVDSTLMRLLWLALVPLWGCTLLAYIAAWIVMPEKPIRVACSAPAPAAASPPA